MFVYMNSKMDIDEFRILQLMKDGETYAFEYLFGKYAKALYQFSFNILKSDSEAEEIVQNVFLKVWERRKGIDPKQAFNAYLFTIALNDIRKSFLTKAKENQFKTELYDVLTDQLEDNQEGVNFSVYLKILNEQIEMLPERRKEIFLLHKKEGLTVSEVAEFLKISPKTVENQLTAALKTIREAFFEKNIKGLYLLFMHYLMPGYL